MSTVPHCPPESVDRRREIRLKKPVLVKLFEHILKSLCHQKSAPVQLQEKLKFNFHRLKISQQPYQSLFLGNGRCQFIRRRWIISDFWHLEIRNNLNNDMLLVFERFFYRTQFNWKIST